MRWVGGCFLAVCAVLMPVVASSAPPARAVPLTFDELGSAGPLEFYGQAGTTTVTFPVPPGMTPTALDATLELPVFLRSAAVTVVQDRRTIAQLDVPLLPRGPVRIPLDGVVVVENAVTITLNAYLLPLDGYCVDPSNPLRLVDGAVEFAGVETVPAAVADFLPPVLRTLTIAVPPDPSQAESDAAVRLATAVTSRYRQQNTGVQITALPRGRVLPAAESAPFERQISITEGPDSGLSLQGGPGIPVLLISGPAAELANQTRLLASDLRRLAISTRAVVGPLRDAPQLPGDTTTLRELGENELTTEALAPRVVFGIDQTRLGRSAHNVRVHLVGSYTPVPENIGAQVVVRTGGETIDRWVADRDGVIDHWVDIPDRLLQRFTNLEVAVDITGNTGRCGEFQPLTLSIDGESTVQSTPARPPVPPGLQSLPQALMPRVEIGIGDDRYADTARAVSIMTGLQRLSALPIDTVVVGVQQAVDSGGPAVLIAADGWDRDDITLPVSVSEDELTVEGADTSGAAVTLRLDPAVGFGALQWVFDGRRSLLVATSNGAPRQLDQLLRWLDEDPARWPRLYGSAVISAPGRTPVTVPAPAVTAQAAPRDSGGGGTVPIWVAAGVFAAAVVTGALLLRRRRG
ncbi:hypothetical protein BST38_18540 [Mycolicibacterium parafortuitum]|nr:hypothetical protein BST38_18540 [Mycolicibacterium parafortuitum]